MDSDKLVLTKKRRVGWSLRVEFPFAITQHIFHAQEMRKRSMNTYVLNNLVSVTISSMVEYVHSTLAILAKVTSLLS